MKKAINKIYNLVLKYKGCSLNDEECKLFQELQNDLENYKILKNPSEAIDRLEYICKVLNEKRIDIKWLFKNDYNIIKQALLKAQKQEKILKIIKEKIVDVCELKICIDEYEDSLYQYNKRTKEKFRLTQEEFDLLKEWLENEK